MGTGYSSSKSTSQDYRRPYRPIPVAVANRIGRLLARMGVEAGLDEKSLIASARKKTGLHDLGSDENLRRRLRILLESLNDEARLHPVGRFMVRQNLVRMLVNLLRLVDAFKKNPGILEKEIRPPVFIAGLQRTGTTLLHRLMSTDPDFRFLLSWEAINPAPFPGKPNGGSDPRIRMAEFANLGLRYLAPDFFAIHPIEVEGPEEDCLLFDYGFWSTVPEATQRVSRFSAWLEQQDHLEAYRFYRKVLQYLQFQRPGGRWLLKTPQHMEHLGTLLEVFPGARIIQTHRDPATTMASFCSMMAHARGVFSDDVDPHEVARHWMAKATRLIERSMEVREQEETETFLDVSYYDLVRDPMSEIRRIYDRLGIELTPEKEARMRDYHSSNPQNKHGKHRYDLESFGLDRDKVEKAFAVYRKKFGIPHE